MSIRTKYYFGETGLNTITDPELVLVTILAVTRSGMVYSRGIINPVNLQYLYNVSRGKIIFRDNFIGPAPDLPQSINSLERVSVKFKT